MAFNSELLLRYYKHSVGELSVSLIERGHGRVQDFLEDLLLIHGFSLDIDGAIDFQRKFTSERTDPESEAFCNEFHHKGANYVFDYLIPVLYPCLDYSGQNLEKDYIEIGWTPFVVYSHVKQLGKDRDQLRLGLAVMKIGRYGKHSDGRLSVDNLHGVDELNVRDFLANVLDAQGFTRNIYGAIDLLRKVLTVYDNRIAGEHGLDLNTYTPFEAFNSFLQSNQDFPTEWHSSKVEEMYDHLKRLEKDRDQLRLGLAVIKVCRYRQHRVGERSLDNLHGVDSPNVRDFLENVLDAQGFTKNIDGAIDLQRMMQEITDRTAKERGLVVNIITSFEDFYSFLQNQQDFPTEWHSSNIKEMYKHLKRLGKGRDKVRRGPIVRVSFSDEE